MARGDDAAPQRSTETRAEKPALMPRKRGAAMKIKLAAFCALLLVSTGPVRADDPEPHLEAAKQAAGFEFTGTLARICIAPGLAVGIGPRGAIPDRALWHAEPARMFDNLYFIGTRVHSAWALKGSGGR